MDVVQSIDLITTNPKVRGGRPCVAGTGLRVIDIVMASLFHSRTPGEIAADYEIGLAQVHAALAYYYQHRDAIDQDLREQVAKAQSLKEKSSGGAATLLP
ncbi:MAG: DUF433 domain-containing protein [Caldilineaceae bacterium]|nr:DUF433 domain-containing protein [Caldilineaceae bacterium]